MTQTYDLWDFACEHETPTMTHYIPTEKKSDWSVVIFPGGGYQHRAVHEGKGYAEFLNAPRRAHGALFCQGMGCLRR